MNPATRRWIVGLVALVGVAGGVVTVLIVRSRRGTPAPDGIVDVGAERPRAGESDDRGAGGVALDIEMLKSAGDFQPAVEYLTYIQTKRGTDAHMLFVRSEDLDAIAALNGENVHSLMDRLERLGVAISQN